MLLTFALAMSHCQQNLEQSVQNLHDKNTSLLKDLEPVINDLVSLRNNNNVQGRALTPDEITFTGMVNDLEYSFHTVKQELKASAEMSVDSTRLDKEQELQSELTRLNTSADSLLQNRF